MSQRQQEFTDLYRQQHEAVLAFVLRRLPDGDMTRAEDITQDAFIAAWRNFSALPTNPNESRAWLFSAARNRLMQEHRTLARRGALAVRVANDAELESRCHAAGVDSLTDLSRAWHSLELKDQESLSLATWEGLTSKEAAQVLGITAQAFRVRLMWARRHLAQALESPNKLSRKTAAEPASASFVPSSTGSDSHE